MYLPKTDASKAESQSEATLREKLPECPRIEVAYIYDFRLLRFPASSDRFNFFQLVIMALSTLFTNDIVPEAPADLHYGLRAEFQADSNANKVNLVIGAYKDEAGNPWVLPVVKKAGTWRCVQFLESNGLQAAQLYHDDPRQNHEYLPLAGDPAFCSAAAKVLFGDGSSFVPNQVRSSTLSISHTRY